MILKGRKAIYSPLKADQLDDIGNIADMVNAAMLVHLANASQIEYLQNYHKGVQPILAKTKLVRPEINNITLFNHAQRITRTIVGYFLGNEIQYVQNNVDITDKVDRLNKLVRYEDKWSVDLQVAKDQSIVGTGYRFIGSDSDDEVPFQTTRLDPKNTFVVYENTVMAKPLAGVTYFTIYDKDGNENGRRFQIYTKNKLWVIDSDANGVINERATIIEESSYDVSGVPIIEYPNNTDRIGDWESALSIMDTINTLQSGRMDDIQQIVEALLVFLNAEIDSERYDEMREAGVVMLTSTTQNKVDVKSITNPLDQTAMSAFAKELENSLDILVGIPSRDNRAGGGGDTGQAVELRDGWADLEIVARNKEAEFIKSEKKTLRILTYILNNTEDLGLDVIDVDIKFVRNKSHNLLVKSQSYQNLLSTRTLTPSDALTIVDLVSDANEFAKRGVEYWEVKAKEQQENMMENTTPEVEISGEME